MKAPNARIKNSNVGTPNVFEANPHRPPPHAPGTTSSTSKTSPESQGFKVPGSSGIVLEGAGDLVSWLQVGL